MYGIAEIDIHVPDDHKECFKELQPIFKVTTVERHHLSVVMQDYAKVLDEKRLEMSCRQLLWRNNNVIYRLHQVVFGTWFGCCKMLPVSLLQKSTTLRRFFGFCNSVIAETSKLIGNGAYGIQLINKLKFQKNVF